MSKQRGKASGLGVRPAEFPYCQTPGWPEVTAIPITERDGLDSWLIAHISALCHGLRRLGTVQQRFKSVYSMLVGRIFDKPILRVGSLFTRSERWRDRTRSSLRHGVFMPVEAEMIATEYTSRSRSWFYPHSCFFLAGFPS